MNSDHFLLQLSILTPVVFEEYDPALLSVDISWEQKEQMSVDW